MPTYARIAEVVATRVDDELVLLRPSLGVYFGLKGSAIPLWELLEQPQTAGHLEQALLARYDVEEDKLRADLRRALSELQSAGMIHWSP